MFPCLMARNEIPRPLGEGWKSLTHVLSLPSSSASDLALLLLPRHSSLRGLFVPLPHHLCLRALLPDVSLPLVSRPSARRRFMGPVARPVGDVSLRVVVVSPRGDHLVAPLLTPISHMRATRRLLARFSVMVPCV